MRELKTKELEQVSGGYLSNWTLYVRAAPSFSSSYFKGDNGTTGRFFGYQADPR
jgi:bacteriocin-like protein